MHQTKFDEFYKKNECLGVKMVSHFALGGRPWFIIIKWKALQLVGVIGTKLAHIYTGVISTPELLGQINEQMKWSIGLT